MSAENIEVAVRLPRILWEELQDYAQAEQAEETNLLIQAIEQFLHQADTTAKYQNGTYPKYGIPQTKGKPTARGKYAHLPGSTEAFMNAKQIDIQHEDKLFLPFSCSRASGRLAHLRP